VRQIAIELWKIKVHKGFLCLYIFQQIWGGEH